MMQKMNHDDQHIRIIIAGGGTGGHIFPGLAIAASLQRANPSVRILWVGAKKKMEMQRVPEAGYEIQGIDIAGFNRSSLLKNFSLPVKLIKSYFQVKKILKEFRPDVVVGVGGYSSFPVMRLAQAAGIPTFIHESNSLPGKSNLMLGKKATAIFVAIEGMEQYFPAKKLIVSGNPVRKELMNKADKSQALSHFGLKPEWKTVLVVGGSLGAKSINEAIAENMSFFNKNKFQLIWQTGKAFSSDAARQEVEYSNIWTNAFINRMDLAYAAADVVVARSGAMTVAELQVQGKASILVPYPHAAEDHQTVNAKKLADKGAAILIPNHEVSEKLFQTLKELLTDEGKIMNMEQQASAMAKRNADVVIADEILKKIEK